MASDSESLVERSEERRIIITNRKNEDLKKEYLMRKIIIWKRHNLKDSDLWEQFREEFDEWDEAKFVIVGSKILKKFRAFLRTHDVWVFRKRDYSVVKALFEVLKKDIETSWIEKELASSLEKFNSDVIDHLRKIDFDRNSIDYSWQATQFRFGSRKSESSKRERSIQSSIQSRDKEKLSFRQRSSSFQSIRQRSFESIRQRSSSFHSQDSQKSPSIELQNVQSTGRWILSEKSLFLEKSRRSISLRSFIESSSRSILASFILSSSSSSSSSSLSFLSSSESFKSIESIRTESEGHGKELANLAKLYTNEAKYSGENDTFSFKLTIFHDMCDRADVLQSAKLKAFSIMLKSLTFDYYYSNMFTSTVTVITFDEICFSMRNYFEDAEYRRGILSKWNNLILKSVMTSNEGKSVEECLQLLIKQLRHLQHGLNPKLRSEKFIHNKLINACQDVTACQYACFKLSDSLVGLINDLRSSIIIYQKANSANFPETFETFFTDRRYHKNFSSRINQNHRFQDRRFQDRRFQDRSKRKCFVCQKEECWFTKHSKDEREIAKQKFKNRFFIRIDHYISEYEGTDSSSSFSEEDDYDTDLIDEMKTLIVNLSVLSLISDNLSNVETFMISFGSVKNAEMMITNLANRSLSHFLINNLHISMNHHSFAFVQIGLNVPTFVHICMKDIDLFTYIIIDRYTFAVFYEIMIDSRASVRSIAGYEQYLAFIKNIFYWSESH